MAMALTTDDQIQIDVHDDAAAMAHLLMLPGPARMNALAEMRGISAFDEGPMSMLKQIHETGDGFRVNVEDPRYPEALARLVTADAWGQLRRELARAWEYQRSVLPGIRHPDKVEVTLTLGNPDDPVFIDRTLGYYGMGANPGEIWMVSGQPTTTSRESARAACMSSRTTCARRTSTADSTSPSG